jgi:hypothetical protein
MTDIFTLGPHTSEYKFLLLSLSSLIFFQHKFLLLSLSLSLCYAQLEKEEGWRLALGWSPARTTGTSSSSSPTMASQEYTVSLLLSCFR